MKKENKKKQRKETKRNENKQTHKPTARNLSIYWYAQVEWGIHYISPVIGLGNWIKQNEK